MIVCGRVQNGVVVLEDNALLPERTAVVVWPAVPAADTVPEELLTDEHRRFLEAIDRIVSLPVEGPSEP
jgi:hypothetical protein